MQQEILLSMKPHWYDLVEQGIKIFEYRKIFPEGRVKAYVYVSAPVKKVKAIIHFGEKISLKEWERTYPDPFIQERIREYLIRNNFAVPVEKVELIDPISLDKLREHIPHFVAPQMYYCLGNNMELAEYLHKHKPIMAMVENDFKTIDVTDICKKYDVKR